MMRYADWPATHWNKQPQGGHNLLEQAGRPVEPDGRLRAGYVKICVTPTEMAPWTLNLLTQIPVS